MKKNKAKNIVQPSYKFFNNVYESFTLVMPISLFYELSLTLFSLR
ncbi:hypothetical protein Patl1_36565 [Pistacia atlantica]|nr:hypothetical protein Patl1_36565 [Pistacia atlantica]